MNASSWGQSINNFLSSPLGQDLSKLLSGLAVLFLIIGIAHAVATRHKGGMGAVLRRVLEVIVLCVIFAFPSIWGSLASLVANFVQDAMTYVSTNL
jgi:hypothetical protein